MTSNMTCMWDAASETYVIEVNGKFYRYAKELFSAYRERMLAELDLQRAACDLDTGLRRPLTLYRHGAIGSTGQGGKIKPATTPPSFISASVPEKVSVPPTDGTTSHARTLLMPIDGDA